jgi:hypothetical protein
MFAADRTFQLWRYEVGIGRLLLRSPRGDRLATRVDVLFQNVTFIRAPTVLEGLVVREPFDEEMDDAIESSGTLPNESRQFYVPEGESYRGLIVASSMAYSEDQGSYNDPSPLLC